MSKSMNREQTVILRAYHNHYFSRLASSKATVQIDVRGQWLGLSSWQYPGTAKTLSSKSRFWKVLKS